MFSQQSVSRDKGSYIMFDKNIDNEATLSEQEVTVPDPPMFSSTNFSSCGTNKAENFVKSKPPLNKCLICLMKCLMKLISLSKYIHGNRRQHQVSNNVSPSKDNASNIWRMI